MRTYLTWIVRAGEILVTVALAAVIVLGLFGLGISGGIGDNYVDLEDPDAPLALNVAVDDYDGSSITLQRGDGDELTRNGSWGLEYPGGYGQVGAIVSATDESVTRSFSVAEGEPPVPGTVARLDPSNWRGDPSAIGVSFSDVSYSTELGEYPAWLTGPATNVWLIVVHGKGGDLAEGLRLVAPAAEAGMRSMLITYRNDREAPAGTNGDYQWGKTEWRDLEGAVSYAIDNGADGIVVAGYGMGGSIVLSFLRESDQADRVIGAILDSPVIDLEATVAHDLAQDDVGAVFDMPSAINESARLIAGWRFDLDWGDLNFGATQPAVPTLIFHGDADLGTPLAESEEYTTAAPQLVKLVVGAGAGFTESWNVDPGAYDAAVRSFLDSL